MPRTTDPVGKRTHRQLAGYLFNRAWSLLEQKARTPEEDEELIHTAHASRYHWGRVGGPLQLSVGEWQLSRVYAVLGRPEPATFHGRRAAKIAREAHLPPFYLAYGFEARARASALAGRRRDRGRFLKDAARVGATVRDPEERRMLLDDLATIR